MAAFNLSFSLASCSCSLDEEEAAEEAFFKVDEDSETEEDSEGGFCKKDVTSSLF